MIAYMTGDILTTDAEALVNTVNCVGVMGRGIALQFKKAFPDNYKVYATACKREEVQPGRMFVYETGHLTNPQYIINFPTKRHWKGKSRMEDIESGLVALAEEIRSRGIRTIAIPPLGSGLGGLEWRDVRRRMEDALSHLEDVEIIVFEPNGAKAEKRVNRSTEVPKMTAGSAALVGLIDRYLGGLLDPFVTLLEVHKLMYFMQEAGEPLRLRFEKGPYGPYGENIRHVLNKIEGHLVSGYEDGGDNPDKQIELVPGALKDAKEFLKNKTETEARFEKVCDLVEGFESPFGLELLSTVHWVVKRNQVQSVEDVVRETYAWGDRKMQFSPRQIAIAIDVFSQNDWIDELAASG